MGLHTRREGFPSWCWAGWYDRVEWRNERFQLKPVQAPFQQGAISVEVELASGRLLSWSEYQEKYAELNDNSGVQSPSSSPIHLSHYIHIEADVSWFVRDEHTGYLLGVEAVSGERLLTPNLLSNRNPNKTFPAELIVRDIGRYLLMHFQNWEVKESLDQHPNCALLMYDRGGYWERIALFDDEERLLRYAKKTRMKVRVG